MRLNSCQRPDTGFTLIELIVALVVAGVLLTIAVPSMRSVIQDTRIISYTNELVLSLSLARSEAVKRNTTVSLCASDDGIDCTDTDWELGWIVFTDNGVLGAVDADDIMLRVQQAVGGGLALTGPILISYQGSGALVAACENCIDDGDSSSGDSGWVARILWALVPISDAMAAPGNNGNSGNNGNGGNDDNGGFQSGCSDQNNSNNANSENANCNGGGGGGNAGGGGAGATMFTVCDDRTGETGRAVNVVLTGRVNTSKLGCE